MEKGKMRVGEVARKTGLTVRTLHHWEAVGLLAPQERTPAGHRIYGSEELERLHSILGLRQVGLSLEEIKDYLQKKSPSLDDVLRMQRSRIQERIRLLRELDHRLERIQDATRKRHTITEDDLLDTMEMMMTIDKHFTPDQRETLKARRESLGPDAIHAAEEEWPRLIARVKEEMEKGTDPGSGEVQKLARRWKALIEAFSGGDEGIEGSLADMYRDNPQMARDQGMDPELFRYIGAAMGRLGDG